MNYIVINRIVKQSTSVIWNCQQNKRDVVKIPSDIDYLHGAAKDS